MPKEHRATEHLNGTFPAILPPLPTSMPDVLERALEGEEDAYKQLYESICGATDDSQPVEQYDGTLGVIVAFVNAHQGPVGQLQWNDNLGAIYTNPGNVSGVGRI